MWGRRLAIMTVLLGLGAAAWLLRSGDRYGRSNPERARSGSSPRDAVHSEIESPGQDQREPAAPPFENARVGRVESPTPPPRLKERVKRMAPPITAAAPGTSASFVMRDRKAAAFFTEKGVAIALHGPGSGWGLHWGLAGVRDVVPRPDGKLPGRVSRFVGDPAGWRSNQPTYSTIVYADVRPGVDLIVEAEPRGLKYSLHADAGSAPGSFSFRYEGAREIRVVEDGAALEIETGLGVLREDGLLAYQEGPSGRETVPARYVPNGPDGYRIELGAVDPSRPLVVDPTLNWGSYIGGSQSPGGGSDDFGRGVAVDGSGNVYVAGTTLSSDFPIVGGFDGALGGTQDAFVAKFDPSGASLLWTSYLGGSADDWTGEVAADASGNVYVAGYTESADFPITGGFDGALDGTRDAFIAKIGPDGSAITWSSYLGGTEREEAWDVLVDGGGAVYLTGLTRSSDFPLSGAFDSTFGGVHEAFVTKVNPDGASLAWSSFLGGSANDFGNDLALDGSGNVYIVGITQSLDFPTTGGFQLAPLSVEEGFVTKVNSAGSAIIWSSYLGGSGADSVLGVAVDGSGNVYVSGQTYSSDFPSSGGFDATLDGTQDAFVTKIAGGAVPATLTWSSFLGGGDVDYAMDVVLDGSGDLLVTGRTDSSDFPSAGGFDGSLGGTRDAFVAKVDVTSPTPAILWSSYLGGSGLDMAWSIDVDAAGAPHVAGDTDSTDFPTTGGYDSTPGGQDAFITKVDVGGTTLAWSSYLGDLDPGDEFAHQIAVDGSGNVYVTGNTVSLDFPTPGGYQTTHGDGGGTNDAYVFKIDGSGPTLEWATYLGGAGSDVGWGVVVDGSGNVYVTGSTASDDFPIVGGFQGTKDTGTDAFVAKVAPNGASLVWSSFLGANGSDFGHDLEVDASGSVYVTGSTSSTLFPTSGGFDSVIGGSQDAFVAKVNASGASLAWSSFLGGSGSDVGYALGIDGLSNVYVSGSTSSADFPAGAGFQTTSGGGSDAFVAKVDAAGNSFGWGSYLGGSSIDTSFGISVATDGTVYVTGYTGSADFPVTGGFDMTHNGGSDVFVAKVDPSGSTLTWASYHGGTGADFGSGVEFDASGNVYVEGTTTSTDMPTPGGVQTTYQGGARDAYAIKVHSSGAYLLWSTYLGGSDWDEGFGVAVDSQGRVYATGATESTDFPTTGGFDTVLGPIVDVFVVRLDQDTTPPAITSITSATLDGSYGAGAAVDVTVNFSEAVTLEGGNLEIALDTGAVVSIPPFGPATTASGSYVVQAGHTSSDLAATSPLTLTGGILRDVDGYEGSLAVPGGQNLDDLKDIEIDTTGPAVVRVTSTTLDGSYNQGSAINVTVDFTEPVILSGGNLEVTLDTGDVVSIPPFGPSASAAGTYVVGAGDATVDLTASTPLGLSAGSLGDPTGNAASLSIPGGQNLGDLKDIEIDTQAPAVTSVTSGTTNGAYRAGQGIDVTVNFSEAVTLSGGNLLVTLDTGAVVSITPFATAGSGSATYTISAGENSLNLTSLSPLVLQGGAFLRDAAGNDTTLTIPGGQNLGDLHNLVVDTVIPQVAGVTSPTLDDTYGAGASIGVTVTFTEPVTLLGGNLLVALDSGGLVTIPAFGPSAVAAGIYLVGGGENSPDLAVAGPLTLSAGTLTDGAGNGAALGIPGGQNISDTSDIIVDTQDPIVTITSPTALDTFTTGSTPLSLGGSASDNLNLVSVTWSNPDVPAGGAATGTDPWSASIPLVAGQNTVTVTATDDAGNTATDILTITFDPSVPTITIDTPTALSSWTTSSSPITVGGTASDDVGVTSVTWSNPAVPAGGAATGTTNWSTSIPLVAGPNVITVTATDAAANTGTDVITITLDQTAPSVTGVDSATPDGSYGVGAAIDVTVSFSEPVTLAGGNLEVTLDTGGIVSIPPFGPAALASGTYVVGGGDTSADLTAQNPLTLSGGTLQDAGGNDALLTIPAGLNLGDFRDLVIDTQPPAVAGVTSTAANGRYGQGAVLGITVAFSESVTLAGGNLEITLDTGAVVQIAPFGPAATAAGTYVVGAGEDSPDLTAQTPFVLAGGAALTDGAGNSATLTVPGGQNLGDQKDIEIDTTAPVVAVDTPTAAATWATNATPIALGGTAADAGTLAIVAWDNPAVPANGAAAGLAAWTASVPLALGANVVTVTATDDVGNAGADVITVTYDPTPPTLSIDPLPPGPVTVSPIGVTGSAGDNEGVTSVTWINGATGGSGVATGGASWSANIPLAPGANPITIVAWDAAGNATIETATVTYTPPDSTPPTVTIDTPTTNPTFTAGATPVAVGGSSSDNVGVTIVRWINETTGVGGVAGANDSWSVSVPLTAGTNVVTVTAEDAAGNVSTDAISIDFSPAPDATPPTVQITIPVAGPTFATGATPVQIGGTSSDDVEVSSVSWQNAATGGAGVASGQAAWTADVPLAAGDNLLTVTATDPSGNTATDTITVTFTPPVDTVSPILVITVPTTGVTHTTSGTPIALGGYAADDVGLATVVWQNAGTGASGTAMGLGSWTALVDLIAGANLITLTAYDTAGNTGTATITVSYQAAVGGGGGGGGGGCGLTGLEPFLFALGVLLLGRRWGTS